MAGFSHTCDHESHVQGLLLGCSSCLVSPTPPSSVPLLRIWLGFPGGSEGKASARNAGDLGLIPGSGRSPGEGKWQPTSVLLPGKSHGQRSLVGYTPWCGKESDTTEQLHFSLTSLRKFPPECC